MKYWKPVSAISNLQRVCTQVDCEMGLIRVWNYTLSTVYIDLGLWVHCVSILRMKYFAVIVGKCFVFSASSLDSDLFNCYKSQSEYPLKMSFEIIQTDTERKGSCVVNCFLKLIYLRAFSVLFIVLWLGLRTVIATKQAINMAVVLNGPNVCLRQTYAHANFVKWQRHYRAMHYPYKELSPSGTIHTSFVYII